MEPTQQPPAQQTPEPVVSTTETASPNNGKKKLPLILGGVLVLVLIVATVALVVTHHSLNTAAGDPINRNHPEDHTYETVVSLTNDGFMPATTTVKPATEVFFDNKVTNDENEIGSPIKVMQSKAAADQASYFASDPIANNSEYGYTFRTPGTYQFYDYDHPQNTLTIIVKN